MSDPTWNEYVLEDGTETLNPLEGTTADTSYDANLAADESNNIDSGDLNADWSSWNAATGDENATTAQSYFDAAESAAAGGYTDYAQDLVDSGNVYADSADSAYATAGDYADAATSDYSAAGSDSTLLADDAYTAAADTSSYDTAAADTSSYDTSSYDTAAADTSSYDATSYDTSSDVATE